MVGKALRRALCSLPMRCLVVSLSGEKDSIVLVGKVPKQPCEYRSPSSGRLKATQNEK